jgi:metallophosphoesterase superfamily enzyme
MTWVELSKAEQESIITRYKSGTSVDELSKQYNLRSESLSRKMRLLGFAKKDALIRKTSLALNIKTPSRVLIYADTHFGMEDTIALSSALIVAREYDPEIIINLGDTLDCYNLSRFKKEPQNDGLQFERDKWYEWAEKLNIACPNAAKYILRGNHEDRFNSILADVTGLADMPELTLDNLLYTRELGYNPIVDSIYVNPRGNDVYPDAQIYILHGERALSNAGASAKAASDMYAGASTITGHAHRTAMYTRRTGRGIVTCYEVGTLAKLNPEYELFPNWSNSFLIGVISLGFHSFTPILIDEGRFMFDGKLYG